MNIQPKVHPCVILGAGPAGISAALWLHTFEVPFRWFGGSTPMGGTLNRVYNRIDNFPPRSYDNGAELARELAAHLERLDIPSRDSREVTHVDATEAHCRLTLDDGQEILASTIIVATGTTYRTLGVPGESEGLGRHVSQSATADGHRYARRPVAVVGGGDAGFENALRLADIGCPVSMLLRNPNFSARQHFVDSVKAHPLIELFPFPTIIQDIDPTPEGCRLTITCPPTDSNPVTHLDVACLFVRIGVKARLPLITPALDTANDYLLVDAHQRTSHPRILAAGDVTDTALRSVATAMGAGAIAAQAVLQTNS